MVYDLWFGIYGLWFIVKVWGLPVILVAAHVRGRSGRERERRPAIVQK